MILLIGLIVGLVLGLTGAGGSVFAVPLLILIGGLNMNEAVGISLAAVSASALFGSLRAWRGRSILWTPGIVLAAAGMVFAPLGQWLSHLVPQTYLLLGFVSLACVIAARMWLQASRSPQNAQVVRAGNFAGQPAPGLLCSLSQTGQFELRPRCVSGLLIGGALVGVISGLLGVGGGFLIVPLLLALSPISMAQAVSTSLVIIAAISSSGFISYQLLHPLVNPQHHLTLLALVITGSLTGMLISQRISHKIADARLQKIFAASLILVCLVTLGKAYL